jgi:hypothetical protein
MRLHKHFEGGRFVVTDGADYPDCPPDRKCWFDGPETWLTPDEVSGATGTESPLSSVARTEEAT